MSRHKNFVATQLISFCCFELCRDINFFIVIEVSSSNCSALLQHSLLCCDILLWFFSTSIMTIISFVSTKFLIVAWIYCRDRVLLAYTTETELCVVTDSENVATYFLL